MHRIFRVKAYEAEHGPHFNEEHARKAVSKMENEDGTRGPHWSIEETTTLANQYGISLGNRFNRYDWFVALNMVYSDYYKVIINITNSNSTKHFVELAKAWINDKDIDEGKMWYYYIYVMCDKIRQAEMECYEEEVEKRDKYEEDDDDEFERIGLFRRGGRSRIRLCLIRLIVYVRETLHQTATFGNMISSATAPIVTKLNSLQSDVDGIKCKLPNTVSVPYPQLSCYNPEIFRAAAMGAYAGDAAFNGVGYNNGCGCGC